ncbi:tetratricopeptide repeat protein [Sulfuriferula multivorans]|nr:tetratricopeptide repeat protein [Sulfuriferula multivorans]
MTDSRFVMDATRENFSQLVLGNSEKGPVMVHFWTPKAGPCMLLMPRLVKLTAEYNGKFLLVMVNTDELGHIARQYGVTSVPTVKFFRHGQVVHTIHGADPDAEFRKVLDRFIARDNDAIHVRALTSRQHGDEHAARMLLVEAALADPDNPRIPADLAKLLMSGGELQQAHDLLTALSPTLREDAEISRLITHLDFILTAHVAPPPADLVQRIAQDANDLEARYQLAAQCLVADDMGHAMVELLEIVRRDRSFRQDIGRRGLVSLFDLLGAAHPLTTQYRPLLVNALH